MNPMKLYKVHQRLVSNPLSAHKQGNIFAYISAKFAQFFSERMRIQQMGDAHRYSPGTALLDAGCNFLGRQIWAVVNHLPAIFCSL